jgi:hypothetical protein
LAAVEEKKTETGEAEKQRVEKERDNTQPQANVEVS